MADAALRYPTVKVEAEVALWMLGTHPTVYCMSRDLGAGPIDLRAHIKEGRPRLPSFRRSRAL